jgi:hypothetical protein
VGVANVAEYLEVMEYRPTYIAEQREVGGFIEVVDRLLQVWNPAIAEKSESGMEEIMDFIDQSFEDCGAIDYPVCGHFVRGPSGNCYACVVSLLIV